MKQTVVRFKNRCAKTNISANFLHQMGATVFVILDIEGKQGENVYKQLSLYRIIFVFIK